MAESDVYGRQILTYKVGPRANLPNLNTFHSLSIILWMSAIYNLKHVKWDKILNIQRLINVN